MREIECLVCGRKWSEADAAWDRSIQTGRCPFCSNHLQKESAKEKGTTVTPAAPNVPVKGEILMASQWARASNCFLDSLFIIGLCFGIDRALWALTSVSPLASGGGFMSLVVILYYVGFEYVLGRTPAKMLTGTRVVSIDGKELSLAAVAARTCGRLIPVEWLSFSHTHPRGWHDRFGNTAVVAASLNREQVSSIDFRAWKGSLFLTVLGWLWVLYVLLSVVAGTLMTIASIAA